MSVGLTATAKASWRILPLLGVGYLIAFMDRANISFAATQMNEDLKFSATVYGLGGGLFFLSYALFEVPSNVLLVRFGARRWIARIMVTWGILAAGMMFVRTPLQLYVVRFLLGAAEAGFFPAVIVYLARWFPLVQRGRAISRFYIAGPLGTILMGAISGALLDLDHRWDLRGWQWLFLVQGLPAVFVGVVIFFVLPDEPKDARWLTSGEKTWLERELANDDAVVGEPAKHDLLSALRHPRVLMLGAICFFTIGPYITFYLSTPMILAAKTGLDRDAVGRLVSFGGGLGIVGMLFTGWWSDRRGDRFTLFFVSMVGFAAALAAIALSSNRIVVMIAYSLVALTWTSVTLSTLMVTTAFVHRRLLAVGMAAINTMAQTGAFLFSYLWGVSKDATGSFALGLYALPALVVLAVVLVVVLHRQIRRPVAPGGPSPEAGGL